MEIWKTIIEYPNYEVSNLGRVRNTKTGRVLRAGETSGYQQIDLHKDGKGKTVQVHRLVATVFIPNPESKREVNHINGIKTDNRVENLEWNTRSENVKHAYKTGLKHTITTNKNNFKTNNPNPKQRVRCVETGREFDSQLDAGKYFSCCGSSISSSIRKGHSCKGFHFELI